MKLTDLIPDPEVVIALEADELALRLLPLLDKGWPRHENLTLSLLLILVNGHPQAPGQAPAAAGLYPNQHKAQIEEALREAWAWLEGAALLVPHPDWSHSNMKLSRRARRLAKEADPRRAYGARHLPKEVLHTSIREDIWALFHRGKYDTAVFEAMKAVEVAVRKAANLLDKDLGVSLMRKAFEKASGPLADMSMDEGERDARAHLFAGAIGSYKNPHSHRNVALDDPDEAAEIIMLANHLLRIVDSRATAKGSP
jgi:uncharacterized protein (TIGR02391 family)